MKSPSQTPNEPKAPSQFYRRRTWQAWWRTYMANTPATCRGAWVRSGGQNLLTAKRRLAVVREMFLGGIQLQTFQRFEPGSVLHINLFAGEVNWPLPTLSVRVLRVSNAATGPDWVLSCAFCPLTPARNR